MRRHFSPFNVFVDRPSRTVVVLNAKTASRNIRFILAAALQDGRGLSDPSQGRYRLIKKAREFPFAPVRDYFDAFRNPERYAFYCFVRNPYSRLKSAWIGKLAFGEDEGYKPSARRYLAAIRRFASRHGLPGGADNAHIPFDTFVALVESQADGRRDQHWDLQSSVLFLDAIRYEQLFKIETGFADGMAAVLGRIGLLDSRTTSIAETPRNEGRNYPTPLYDEALAARVHVIYARDFEALGYDRESWRGL